MPDADLDQLRVCSGDIRDHLAAARHSQAVDLANGQLAAALCDLGIAELAAGRHESGIKRLQDALNVAPASELAFHNLAVALLTQGLLRGDNLNALQGHLGRNWQKLPWAPAYKKLLFMPRFLNLEFVAGKCNLNCRMCLGTNHEDYEKQLRYIDVDAFQARLGVAGTIHSLTLSAGDSDPLMHPDFEKIIGTAQARGVSMDMYTNGHLLTPKISRRMVESGVINMINFSIDSVTPETYRTVRGASFEHVIRRIEMLQSMKAELGKQRPWVSVSFVAMADTIHELPDFIRLAQRLGAGRVYVEDLHGWDDRPSDNHPATDNPGCFEFLRDAKRLAGEFNLRLQLPERLKHHLDETADRQPPSNRLPCCSWINGVWVSLDGSYQPCCLIAKVANMGHVDDGPILKNEDFAKVKSLLLAGKVFPACTDKRQCEYVQQQRAAGNDLRLITAEELGDLHMPREKSPELQSA